MPYNIIMKCLISKMCPGPPYFKQVLLQYTLMTQGKLQDLQRIKCQMVLAPVMR